MDAVLRAGEELGSGMRQVGRHDQQLRAGCLEGHTVEGGVDPCFFEMAMTRTKLSGKAEVYRKQATSD